MGALLSDNRDFLVIGVLGTHGSGKSSILSAFHEEHTFSEPIFLCQTQETVQNAIHQTQGIQMAVSPDRIILLDTQPINCASVQIQMISEGVVLPHEVLSQEHLALKQDLEMGVFLMSVCNIVIFVDDDLANMQSWYYLKTLEMLKWNIPDVSTPKVPPTITVSPANNYNFTSNEFLAE